MKKKMMFPKYFVNVCLLIAICLILLPLGGCSQNHIQDEEIFIEEFYETYIGLISSDLPNRSFNEKLDSLIFSNCSKDLINNIPQKMDVLGMDIFLKNQDCNLSCFESLQIECVNPKSKLYLVSYTDSYSSDKVTINIKLVKISGQGLQIDDVW